MTGLSPLGLEDAATTYRSRLEERRKSQERLNSFDRRIADLRLVCFLILLGLGWGVFGSSGLSWFWILLPILGFTALLFLHERVRVASGRVGHAIAFYERGERNLRGTWAGTGNLGTSYVDQDHPYAADLDLFGLGSLFERICRAKTKSGEETLATWLKKPAESSVILQRQQAVDELRLKLDLREDLEILGAEVRDGIQPQTLIDWGLAPRGFGSPLIWIVAIILATSAAASVLVWAFTDVGTGPLALVVLLEVGFIWRLKKPLRTVIQPLDRRGKDLSILSKLLARLELETFETDLLRRLKVDLSAEGESSSQRLAKLAAMLNSLELRLNQFFAPFAALMLWSTFFALAIENWRVRTGPSIGRWLAAIGEIEALLSLAAYAYENPRDPFPEIEVEGIRFDGEAVGHPLLTGSIANDLVLGGETQALLISGSNMSGKSTMLRSVGTNTVLALAGAPVRAKRLRVSVLSIGATLRIQDSLQEGKSRFFAELTRIRLIVELAKGERPLLFLLDEVFHGTNSHDRVIGAGGVVRGLLGHRAIGLVTTHDLALASFAEELAPRVVNMHFDDQFEGGVMTFDYQLKPGVVTRSNALALMRAVGLDV